MTEYSRRPCGNESSDRSKHAAKTSKYSWAEMVGGRRYTEIQRKLIDVRIIVYSDVTLKRRTRKNKLISL